MPGNDHPFLKIMRRDRATGGRNNGRDKYHTKQLRACKPGDYVSGKVYDNLDGKAYIVEGIIVDIDRAYEFNEEVGAEREGRRHALVYSIERREDGYHTGEFTVNISSDDLGGVLDSKSEKRIKNLLRGKKIINRTLLEQIKEARKAYIETLNLKKFSH